MKFFIPAAVDTEQAERVYRNVAKFVDAPVTDKRIWKLRWEHNGMSMACEVGKPLPAYYSTGADPVVAIFDCQDVYMICTADRGVIRGEPVYAGKGEGTVATHFDPSETLERRRPPM